MFAEVKARYWESEQIFASFRSTAVVLNRGGRR